LADSIKSLDWRTRGVQYLGDAPPELVDEVLVRVATLLGIPLPSPPTGG
jgi:mRNA-degrading endonuclease toxin of MazEF toxin-antitoxin module